MLWHMLRIRMGMDIFARGLRIYWKRIIVRCGLFDEIASFIFGILYPVSVYL